MSPRKSLVAIWRDAVRDSELDRDAKAVAFCLSTYLNGHGYGWPSVNTLAAGASIGRRTVQYATQRLELAGFLEIDRSRGRSSHKYTATLPPTVHTVRRSEWSTVQGGLSNRAGESINRARRAPESAESVESGAFRAAAALKGDAARALPEDDCGRCGKRLPLVDDLYCVPCKAKLIATGLVEGVRRDLASVEAP